MKYLQLVSSNLLLFNFHDLDQIGPLLNVNKLKLRR